MKLQAACANEQRLTGRLALCQVVLLDGNAPPEWIQLIPAGARVDAIDGRSFRNPRPEAIVAAFNDYPLDLPLDYEHASEIKAPKGEDAPAAAWIKELEVRDGSVWARVEWTDRGAASVRSKEYRYLSPAFYHTEDGEITELTSAGLTNKPAFTQLAAVARDQATPTQEQPVKREELIKLLGLAADATDEQISTAVQGAMSAKDAADVAVQAAQTELATARADLAKAAVPDLNKFVPRSEFDAALARADKAEKEIKDGKASAHAEKAKSAVDAAVKSGKVTPASKDFFLATCSTAEGLAQFSKFVEGAPVIGDPSTLDDSPPVPHAGEPVVTDELLAIATRCGISKEAILAELKAQRS